MFGEVKKGYAEVEISIKCRIPFVIVKVDDEVCCTIDDNEGVGEAAEGVKERTKHLLDFFPCVMRKVC